MNTKEVAERLVQLCREGKNEQAIDELYAEDVISKEEQGANVPTVKGKQAVKEKGLQWQASLEQLFGITVSDPLVAENHFTVLMEIDASYKGYGRGLMKEICVYQVKDGQIVSEQFFYNT